MGLIVLNLAFRDPPIYDTLSFAFIAADEVDIFAAANLLLPVLSWYPVVGGY